MQSPRQKIPGRPGCPFHLTTTSTAPSTRTKNESVWGASANRGSPLLTCRTGAALYTAAISLSDQPSTIGGLETICGLGAGAAGFTGIGSAGFTAGREAKLLKNPIIHLPILLSGVYRPIFSEPSPARLLRLW